MNDYQFAALILALVGPLLALARIMRAPESLLLFAAGLLLALVPGLPPTAIDPELVLTLFLPPILYASTVRVSWHLLRFTWLSGIVLGAALVLVTIAAVAVAARSLLLPGLSWTAALLIGVAVALFDTRLFHEAKGRPHVPRAIADTLKARELVGRIMVLATLTVIEQSLQASRVTAENLLGTYFFDIPAGLLLGVCVGSLAVWARRRIDPAPIEIAVSVATPYLAALAAAAAGISVVAAVIATALTVNAIRVNAQTGRTISSTEARINATAFWEEASLIVSSVLFLLAGRAVPEAVGALANWPVWQVALTAAGLLAVVLAVQLCFSLVTVKLSPISTALSNRPQASPVAAAAVMSWSSTRSVIALIIALSIPATLPDGSRFVERDLILLVTTLVVIGSVLIQGLTLPWAVRRAKLSNPDEEAQEEEQARGAMRDATEACGSQDGDVHEAARSRLIALREQDAIGDEMLVRMLRETDLHARALEDDAMPGAGPPNP